MGRSALAVPRAVTAVGILKMHWALVKEADLCGSRSHSRRLQLPGRRFGALSIVGCLAGTIASFFFEVPIVCLLLLELHV